MNTADVHELRCLGMNPHLQRTFLNVSNSSRLISYGPSSIRFPASLHRVTQLIPIRYGFGSS